MLTPESTTQKELSSIPENNNDRSKPPQSDTETSASDPNKSSDSQAALTDISYENITKAEPPENRVKESIETTDDVFSSDNGDIIWLDGEEYVVVDRSLALLAPDPLIVVSKNGTQGELVAGEIPNSPKAGFAWKDTIKNVDRENISTSHLICEFDQAYRLETKSIEHIHKWTPNVNTREHCPSCGKEKSGAPIRIERQASKAVEIRQCTTPSCRTVFRFVRDFPEPETAHVITYDDNEGSTFNLAPIGGVFRSEEQDDFKFPIDTNKGRDDGFFTATEVAEFVNNKMLGPQLNTQFTKNGNEITVEDLLPLIGEEKYPDLCDHLENHNTTPNKEETALKALEHIFENPYSNILTDPALPKILKNYVDNEPYGVVSIKTDRNNNFTVNWKDASGYDKMMRVSFTQIKNDNPNYENYLYSIKRHDLDQIAP